MQNRQIERSSNTQKTWYAQIANYMANTMYTIKAGLGLIPKPFYPDNPAADPIIAPLDGIYAKKATGNLTLGGVLTVLLAFMGWANTWQAIKRFYSDRNKTIYKAADVAVNFTLSAASTAFLAINIAGATTLALTAGPYLLLGALGLGACYGIASMAKHAWRAWQAHREGDIVARNKNLWEIPKHVLSTIVNTLGFVVSFFIGFKVDAKIASLGPDLFQDLAIMKSVGGIYKIAKPLFLGLAAVVTLGIIPGIAKDAWQMNKNLWATLIKAVKKPKELVQETGKIILNKAQSLGNFIKKTYGIGLIIAPAIIALEIVSLSVKALSYVGALALSPVLVLGVGVKSLFTKIKNTFIKPKIETKPLPITPILSTQTQVFKKLKMDTEHGKLKQLIKNKVKLLKKEKDNKKTRAKLLILDSIKEKIGSDMSGYKPETKLSEIETAATKLSKKVFSSFWREEGDVARIYRLANKLDEQVKAENMATSVAPCA
jgi:hypothetical protein